MNEEFGDEKVDLVNVKTGNNLGEYSLKKFWEGYGTVSKRIKDEKGQPAVVRLSGWPGTFGDEFKETLPDRSAEFLGMLPVPCYTGRAAPLNLAASPPDTFARAEVGPRAFITYGKIFLMFLGCAFSSNIFHGQIAQIHMDHLSRLENQKCSPRKVDK